MHKVFKNKAQRCSTPLRTQPYNVFTVRFVECTMMVGICLAASPVCELSQQFYAIWKQQNVLASCCTTIALPSHDMTSKQKVLESKPNCFHGCIYLGNITKLSVRFIMVLYDKIYNLSSDKTFCTINKVETKSLPDLSHDTPKITHFTRLTRSRPKSSQTCRTILPKLPISHD